MDIGALIKIAAELRKFLPHDGVGDDGVHFDAGDVLGTGGQSAGNVPPAAGSDDERFGAGPDGVRETGALQQQILKVVLGEILEIEAGNAGGGVGVNDDEMAAGALVLHEADARQAVPLGEDFVADGLPLGEAHVDNIPVQVDDKQAHQPQSEGDGGGAPTGLSGHVEPHRSRSGKEHADGDDGVGSAEAGEERQ